MTEHGAASASVVTQRRWAVATGVLAALATFASAARSASGGWTPTTDWALIEQTVRNAGEHLPLVGAPSSVGFYHPGPWSYLVLVVPYRLLGSDPQALSLATGLFAAACVAGIVWTGWRRGGLQLALLAALVAVWLAGSQAPGTLADPWNPWMAVLPALWFLLALWSALDGDLAMLPWAVAAGSFAVQAHIAYAPLVAVVVVLCAAAALATARVRRTPSRDLGATARPLGSARAANARADLPGHPIGSAVERDPHGARAEDPEPDADVDGIEPGPVAPGRRGWSGRRALVASSAVTAVLWAPPLLEQLTRSPGNVVRLWRYGTDGPSEAGNGVAQAPGILATELGIAPPWITGNEPVDGFTNVVAGSPAWQLAVPVVLLVLGMWATLGCGVMGGGTARSIRTGLVTAAAALLGTAVATLALEDQRAFGYVVRFTWPVGAFLGVVVAWALLQRLLADPAVRRLPGTVPAAVLSSLVLVAGVRVAVVGGAGEPPAPDPDGRSVVAECLSRVLPDVRDEAGDATVHLADVEFWPILTAGLLNELDRGGHDVAVSEDLGFYAQRPGREPAVGEVALIVVDEDAAGRWVPPTGAREVARCDLLEPGERDELDAIREKAVGGDALTAEESLTVLVSGSRANRWYVYRIG